VRVRYSQLAGGGYFSTRSFTVSGESPPVNILSTNWEISVHLE
jgi:hypothetical protein